MNKTDMREFGRRLVSDALEKNKHILKNRSGRTADIANILWRIKEQVTEPLLKIQARLFFEQPMKRGELDPIIEALNDIRDLIDESDLASD